VAPEILRAIEAAAPATVRTQAPETALRVMKRRLSDADVYLLFNEGAQPLDTTVTLPNARGKAELWDPQTGSVSALPAQATKGSLSIALHFGPDETRVVVVRAVSAAKDRQ